VSFDGKSLLLTSAQSRQKDYAIIAEVISQNPRLAKIWTDIMEVEKVSKS
jgi:hypothetical protein